MTHTGTTQPSRSGRPRHLDDADQPTLDPTFDVGSSGAGGLHPSDPDAVVSSHATVPPGTTVAPDATVPPTPPPGTPRPTPAAPRGRRRDHLLTAVVGAALVPVLLELGSRALAAASPFIGAALLVAGHLAAPAWTALFVLATARAALIPRRQPRLTPRTIGLIEGGFCLAICALVAASG